MTILSNMDLKTHIYTIALSIFLALDVTLKTDAVTPSKCQKMMASLSCSWNYDTRAVVHGLAELSHQIIQMKNIIDLSNVTDQEVLATNLENMNVSVQNLTEAIHNISYTPLSEFIGENYYGEGDGDKTERLNIALLCLWIELQSLTRNVSVMSTAHNSGKLATDLKLSDLTMQIAYLQQNLISVDENMTFLYEKLHSIESTPSFPTSNRSLEERLTVLNHTFHKDHMEKITKLKSKLKGKGVGGDKNYQSTLSSHFNAIPEVYEEKGVKSMHELVVLMEESNLRMLNLSLTLLRTETEVETMKNDFSRRLATLEEIKSATQRGQGAVREERPHTNKTVNPASAITAETCNGSRRHLVGNSCYYLPLVRETEPGQTWWDSRYLCKDILGPAADLVAIESQHEMNNIIRMISNHFGGIEEFWIGGNDLEQEGHWQWVMTSGSVTEESYSNWGRPPFISPSENCMSMLRGFKWAAEPCFYQRHPVCELNLDV